MCVHGIDVGEICPDCQKNRRAAEEKVRPIQEKVDALVNEILALEKKHTPLIHLRVDELPTCLIRGRPCSSRCADKTIRIVVAALSRGPDAGPLDGEKKRVQRSGPPERGGP